MEIQPSDDEVDYEALVDIELSSVTLSRREAERLPCRDLEYPVPTWVEEELRSVQQASPLLSGDALSMRGSAAVVASRPTTSKKPKARIDEDDDEDVDISSCFNHAHVAREDKKWADTISTFRNFLDDSNQRDALIQVGIDDLRRLGDAVTTRADESTSPPAASDEHAQCDALSTGSAVLHLSDISDDDDRDLVVATGTLQDLEEGFREEDRHRRQEEEERRKEAHQAVDRELQEKQSAPPAPEVALLRQEMAECEQLLHTQTAQQQGGLVRCFVGTEDAVPCDAPPVAAPHSRPDYAQLAEEVRRRDEEFAAALEEQERRAQQAAEESAAALASAQEERLEAARALEAEEERAEQGRREREEARLAELAVDNARRRREDRCRSQEVRQQGEVLRMEAADVESQHAVLLLQERERRLAAVERAKRVAAEAEAELRVVEEQRPLMEEEVLRRDHVVAAEGSARAALSATGERLRELVIQHEKQRRQLFNDEDATRRALCSDHVLACDDRARWMSATLQQFRDAVCAVFTDEAESRLSVKEDESARRDDLIATAERNHSDVEQVATQVEIARRRRFAYNQADRVTEQGQVRALAMLQKLGPTEVPPTPVRAVSRRLAALRLQEELRSQWLQFFSPDVLPQLQKRRVLPASQVSPRVPLSARSRDPPQPLSGAVVLDDKFLRNYDPNLQRLQISFEGVKKVLGPFEHLQRLTELHIANNEVEHIAGTFPSVTDIDLTENRISNLGFLEGFHALRKLRVDSNSIRDLSGIENCAHLKELHARHNCVPEIGVLKSCEGLLRLDVFGNNLSSLDLPEVSSLTYLNAGRNALRDVTNVFRSCPLLLEAHLYNNRISAIPSRMHCVLLRSLLLGDNFMEKIPDLTYLPCLTHLNMSSNRLTDASGVRGCLHLEVLELSFNSLGDGGGFVSSVEGLQRLAHLGVNQNPMWTADPVGLAASLAAVLPSLSRLNSDPVQRADTALRTDSVADAHDLSAFDDVCLCQIRELRLLEAAQSSSQELTASLEHMALQHLQVHATRGVAHLQQVWVGNGASVKRRHLLRVDAAACTIGRWFRRVCVRRRRTAAAVRIQSRWRGAVARLRLSGARWEDEDQEQYGEVNVDFSPGIDTSHLARFGEIFAAFSGSMAPVQGMPAQAAKSIVRTPPASESSTSSAPTPTPPPRPQTEDVHSEPLTEASLVWMNGAKKRGKRFQVMQKRRQQQERYLPKESTLEGKMQNIHRTIEEKRALTKAPQQAAQRRRSAAPPAQELELQSISSTMTTDERSFGKSAPLPPLRPRPDS